MAPSETLMANSGNAPEIVVSKTRKLTLTGKHGKYYAMFSISKVERFKFYHLQKDNEQIVLSIISFSILVITIQLY